MAYDKILAVGDSWFHYPKPVGNIISHLKEYFAYNIRYTEGLGSVVGQGMGRAMKSKDDVLGENGEDLLNIAYNTLRNSHGVAYTPSWLDMLGERIRKNAGKRLVILISGGGNDIVGEELKQFLNPLNSGLPLLDMPIVQAMVDVKLRKGFNYIMDYARKKCAENNCTVQFVLHGYAHPPVNGKAAQVAMLKVGPWMKPYFDSCGANRAQSDAAVATLIDNFNDMVSSLAAANPDVHYVDLRGVAEQKDSDWVNELHLTHQTFLNAAGEYHEVLKTL